MGGFDIHVGPLGLKIKVDIRVDKKDISGLFYSR